MKSITFKLWAGITGLVLVILTIIWSFQIVFLKNYYIEQRKNVLEVSATDIAEMLSQKEEPFALEEETLDAIEEIARKTSGRIVIIDADYSVRFFNPGVPDKPPVLPERFRNMDEDGANDKNSTKESRAPEIVLEKTLREYHISRELLLKAPIVQVSETERERGILAVQPIGKEEVLGYVAIGTPLAPIEGIIGTLKEQLSVISILSLAIGTVIAFIFSRYAIKPIRRLQGATHQISKGDFTTRLTNLPDDEIGDLGHSINHMAEELGKMERFRRDFIANVTHELKTPLSLISAYAELVKESSWLDKDECNHHMQDIMEEAARLNGMVEEILTLSKIESDMARPELKSVNLKNSVDEAVKTLEIKRQQKQMEINVSIQSDTWVLAEEDGLRQIFVNVIGNALYHCPAGTIVNVFEAPTPTAGYRQIVIEDNGQGIPAEDLPYIWNRFYRVDRSGKRNTTGTGLGLSIVASMLKIHGAQYGIESTEGKGTRIWFQYRVAS